MTSSGGNGIHGGDLETAGGYLRFQVLVTGGCGLIGSFITNAFKAYLGMKEKLEVSHRLHKKWQTPVLLQGAWARGYIELDAIGKQPAQIRQVRGFHLAEHPELLSR